MAVSPGPRVRVVRIGAVVISHHLDVPDVAFATEEVERVQALLAEIPRPAAILTLPDRVLPPASAAVREIYRRSAEQRPIAVWSAVVSGVMGFAASIATSIGAQVFSHRPVPMRVFRAIPAAVAWMEEITDLGAARAEVIEAADALRAMPAD
jgi:hypothetical protein